MKPMLRNHEIYGVMNMTMDINEQTDEAAGSWQLAKCLGRQVRGVAASCFDVAVSLWRGKASWAGM